MKIGRLRLSFWIGFGICAAVWVILGFVLKSDTFPLNDIFDVASLAAFFAALGFVAVYTLAGFIGPKPRSRWWKNELGTYLVLAKVSIMLIAGPVAFAVLFNDGLINTWWWAWVWTGGFFMAAVMVGGIVYMWARNIRGYHPEA